MQRDQARKRVAIIGGGFTGLAAAHELAKSGLRVILLEQEASLGGLASDFKVGPHRLERFYHHWFASDEYVFALVRELGLEHRIVLRPSRTGMYYASDFFKLSSPLDLMRFRPLKLIDRIRLGLVVPWARMLKDWKKLEGLTAREWLVKTCGAEVFRVVWEPLLVGKFGPYANEVSAVWFWNKIALRGSSRTSEGREALAYFRGGFGALADAFGDDLRQRGVEISLGTRVRGLSVSGGKVTAIDTDAASFKVDAVIATPALPIIADLLEGHAPADYLSQLRRIKYLANICLVLELDRSLSEIYWLNVADPGFPFVGIIEHTNFEPPESYSGRHIVYLSKYLPADHPLYALSQDALLDFALPHIQRMFPSFERTWLQGHHVWRADYAQPIVERHYSKIVPGMETPLANFFISTMAQVYPEDRGTNYAIRNGRAVGLKIAGAFGMRSATFGGCAIPPSL